MIADLLVATRKGLFTFSKGRRGWRVSRASFLGDNVEMVLPDPRDRTLYASLNHGHFGVKLHRSRDAGATWSECAAPQYPPQPAGLEERDPFSGRLIEWKLASIWSLEAGDAGRPGALWAGTMPGGLFRSADGGESWDIVRSLWEHPRRPGWVSGGAGLPGIHSICVNPRDGDRVTVGVSCGGVWFTQDGGASWECRAQGMRAAYMPEGQEYDPYVQDPHRVVQCAAAPDRLWAQHHNGIFRSDDASLNWVEIKPARLPSTGFAAAVHPADPDTAWFVPTATDMERLPADGKVVVSRTRDGGKTFKVLRKGLPQLHAYDLTYRHGLDVEAGGDALAFGSTSGSLWLSEDQGDSWQCLSNHLPPVYCVRFGF